MHLVMAGVTAPSHIYPSLGVLTELVSRGHRITYMVGDRHTDLVALTGAEIVSHDSVMPDPETPWPEDPGEAMQVFLDEAIEVLPQMLEKIPAPDAVLYDIGGLAGRVAAHHWQVPAVQLSPAYVAWEGMAEETAEHTAQLKASPSGKHYCTTLDSWLAKNGVSIDADDFLGKPDSCVALVPKALQPNADRVSDRYVFTGPCIDPARRTGWAPEPGDDRPLVYVALGTSYTDRPDIYRLCIEQLAESYRLVISTGKVDPASLGPLPHGVQAAPDPAAARRAGTCLSVHHPRRDGQRSRVTVVRGPHRPTAPGGRSVPQRRHPGGDRGSSTAGRPTQRRKPPHSRRIRAQQD